MPTPFETNRRRRLVVIGAGAVIWALWLTREALNSIRTGIPIPTPHSADTNGWVALAAAALLILLGLSAIGMNMNCVKLRGTPPDR